MVSQVCIMLMHVKFGANGPTMIQAKKTKTYVYYKSTLSALAANTQSLNN